MTTPVPKISMRYDRQTKRAVYRNDESGRELGLSGVTLEQAERFIIRATEMLAVDCRATGGGGIAIARPLKS